jgi:cell division protein FtsI (penicillin-binding protein 3)
VFASDGELKPVTVQNEQAVAGRPVMRPETAIAVRRCSKWPCSPQGLAPKAQVPGYRIAGKTGLRTSWKDMYTAKFVSSFVGFALLPRRGSSSR